MSATRPGGSGDPAEGAPEPAALRALGALVRASEIAASAALALLLAVVVAAILGRLVFDLSGGRIAAILPGAIEFASLSLMALVLFGLPGAVRRGLVRVDLLTGVLPARAAGLLARLWAALLAAGAATLAVLVGRSAALQAARGDVTQDLGLPIAAISAGASAALAVLALTALATALGPAPAGRGEA